MHSDATNTFWTVPVRAVVTLFCDYRAQPSGISWPLGAPVATLLFDFHARHPGTRRPPNVLIAASATTPVDPPCDIMHGSTYPCTVRHPTSAPTAGSPLWHAHAAKHFPLTAPESCKVTNCCKHSLPPTDSLKSTGGWVGNIHVLNTFPLLA